MIAVCMVRGCAAPAAQKGKNDMDKTEQSHHANMYTVETALAELGIPEWLNTPLQSKLVISPEGAPALTFEEAYTGMVRISRRRDGAEVGPVWLLGFTSRGGLGLVMDDAHKPATAARSAKLTDVLWSYRRHAAEDADCVRHVER
jgi:hypothetical protein